MSLDSRQKIHLRPNKRFGIQSISNTSLIWYWYQFNSSVSNIYIQMDQGFWQALFARLLPTFMMARFFECCTGTSSSPPATSSLSAIESYTPRDPMSGLMLFNLTNVRAMFTLVFMFMLLNHTSIRAMLILVSEIVMIYILVLIQKLPNYSTIQKLY